MTGAIGIRDLRVAMGGRTILDRVSIAVSGREHLAVIGPNGAGKTTLLRCLMRIIPATSGEIRVLGNLLGDYSQRELARVVSYVPQSDGRALSFSVYDFVAMGRFPHVDRFARMARADRDAVREALELTGTSSLSERVLATLSGGERQCVLIAAALAQGAQILLLDEPTTFLDPGHQARIHALVDRLRRDLGMTVIAATHDVNSAASWCDRVLALKDGAVAFVGTSAELMRDDVLETIYDRRFAFVEHPEDGARFIAPDRRPA